MSSIRSKVRFLYWAVPVLAVFILAAGCASKEEKKGEHLEKAREYVQKNELKKAVIEYKNAAQLDPKDDTVYYELGDTFLKLKQGREAFQAFSQAASVNPTNLKAQLKVGQILLLGKQTEEARKKAELVLEKEPQNVEALSLLSGVQLQERDPDAAIKTLEKAASLDPNRFSTQLSLARVQLLAGDLDKSEEAYLTAISLDPESSIPYIELSRLYARKGELEKAEEELKKLIDASGPNYQNLYALALFYESTKRPEEAEKTYLQAAESASEGEVAPFMSLGAFYARQKSYDKALEAMNKALSVKKDDLNVQLAIAQLHFDFKKMEQAEAVVDRILEKDQGHIGANFLKGRLFLVRQDYANALERFNLVVRESPRNAMGYHFRALTYIAQGEPKLAQQDLLKAVELNPRLLDARLLLADFFLRERNQDLAREQVEAALRLAPRDVRALMAKGNLKILERDAKGAEAAFKQVIELSPSFAPAYVRLGLLYNLSKQRDKALNFFQKALELNPRQTDALALIVGIYVADKKFDQALQTCEAHKQKLADNPGGLALIEYLQGNVFLAKKDSKTAEAHFRKAIDTEPNLLSPYVALAKVYMSEKRFDEAISEYENILAKNPNYLAGYMALGTLYDQKGEGEKAEPYYRKALEIKRDFGPAANNLAWNLADRGGNIDEALTYAQIAKEQMPNSSAVMDTLGWIYYLKGSYLNAISEFQDSLARDPENPVINYHMGLAYFKNNQPDKAREYLQKALSLDENFDGAEEAKKVLEEIKS
jgi:tetratricopeptide (TPR) repeat protein